MEKIIGALDIIFDVVIGFCLFHATIFVCEDVVCKFFMYLYCFIFMYIRVHIIFTYLKSSINFKNRKEEIPVAKILLWRKIRTASIYGSALAIMTVNMVQST